MCAEDDELEAALALKEEENAGVVGWIGKGEVWYGRRAVLFSTVISRKERGSCVDCGAGMSSGPTLGRRNKVGSVGLERERDVRRRDRWPGAENPSSRSGAAAASRDDETRALNSLMEKMDERAMAEEKERNVSEGGKGEEEMNGFDGGRAISS